MHGHLLTATHANRAFSLSGKSIIFRISHYLLSIRSTTISLQINEIIIVWQKSAKRLWLLFQFAPQFCEIAAHRHGDTYSRRSNLLRNWQSWTYTCNACEQGWQTDSAGSSRMKAIKEYYKKRSGCPQEGHLIWGETIIGVGLVDNRTLLPSETHFDRMKIQKELELAQNLII